MSQTHTKRLISARLPISGHACCRSISYEGVTYIATDHQLRDIWVHHAQEGKVPSALCIINGGATKKLIVHNSVNDSHFEAIDIDSLRIQHSPQIEKQTYFSLIKRFKKVISSITRGLLL